MVETKRKFNCAIFWTYGLFLIHPSLQLKNPDVLFIVVDDLRPAIGAFGDTTAFTPNIDRLASQSFVFTNAFAQQALCAPSRNSFLTSRRPDSLRLYDFYSYWRDVAGNFTTLPQHFRENDYFTHSIGKVFHPGISSNYTDDAKYSWSDAPFHPITNKYKESKVCVTKRGSLARNLVCPVIVQEQPHQTLPDLENLNAASYFLNEYAGKDPYFLAVGFQKPHIPFKFPVEYLRYHPIENITLPKNRWRPSLLPTVAWNPWTDVRDRDDVKSLNVSFPFGEMPDNFAKKIKQSYAASVTYIDDLIGSLLKQVDEDTIIVLMGDHGWSMGEHGEFSKYSNFDIATRVPLIIRVPGLSSKRVDVDELVELVDIFPTLVDLTQVTESLEVCYKNQSNSILCTEGKSLVPLMVSSVKHQDGEGKSAVFMQYPRPGEFPTLHPNSDKPRLKDIKIMGYSMRTEKQRYTEWVEFDNENFQPNWKNVYGRELYDHAIDPSESLNLAGRSELKPLMKTLKKQLILGWRYA